MYVIVEGGYAREFEFDDPDFKEFVEAYTCKGDSVMLVDSDVGQEMVEDGEITLVEGE